MLSATDLWINEQARDEQGGYVFGNMANEPVKAKKLRRFSCWISTLKPDSDPVGPGEWSFARDQLLHDQGGRLWLEVGDKAFVKGRFEDAPSGLALWPQPAVAGALCV